jgi:hypothetical protein
VLRDEGAARPAPPLPTAPKVSKPLGLIVGADEVDACAGGHAPGGGMGGAWCCPGAALVLPLVPAWYRPWCWPWCWPRHLITRRAHPAHPAKPQAIHQASEGRVRRAGSQHYGQRQASLGCVSGMHQADHQAGAPGGRHARPGSTRPATNPITRPNCRPAPGRAAGAELPAAASPQASLRITQWDYGWDRLRPKRLSR